MTPRSFAARLAQPRISFGDLALALAAEFRPVEHVAAAWELTCLAGRLIDTHRLPPADQLARLGELVDDFRSVSTPVRLRPLMLDAVLADRAGDPMLLAVLGADVARRAGLDVGIVGVGRHLFVAHRRCERPLVLDVAGRLHGPGEIDEGRLRWRCAHQVSFALIDELLERSRRGGDLGTALTAAELRMTLPVDDATRIELDRELAGLRASLN
jgi:hypothetical protein